MVFAAAAVLWAGCDRSAYELPGKQKANAFKLPTSKVERIVVVEAEPVAEISIRLEAWTRPLAVKEAIGHGTAVNKGDVLVQLDLNEIDESIKRLKADRALASLAIKHAEEELLILEHTEPPDLPAVEPPEQLADEEIANSTDSDRPPTETSDGQAVAVPGDADKSTPALARPKRAASSHLTQRRLALEKLRCGNEKSADRLKRLEKDRDAMTVRAPADGIVYYGQRLNGQWTPLAVAGAKLQPSGVLMADEVLMTVVVPRPFFAQAVVEERDPRWMNDKVVQRGFPDMKRAPK